MSDTIGSKLKNAWNAFFNRDPTDEYINLGSSYSYRPDRQRIMRYKDQSIVTSVYNRIAMDVAAINIQHSRLDKNDRFIEIIESGLNNCLTLEANVDQTGRAFLQDVAMSLMDEGVVALVPIDTSFNPNVTGSYDILTMRVGEIIEWYPTHVKVRVYNEKTGKKEDLTLKKSIVAIIENPLYYVMNGPNSTMKRLIRKLSLLDIVDEQSSSGKLDMIIQLPYIIKTEARKAQAENRRKDIENQLADSKFGIAYTDGTERITQLNRPVENNLMKQIEYLTSMLYSQLGITTSILDGTADEQTMLNYYNRTIEPIVSAIVDEMIRKFLTKTARTQLQSILFFRDPFKLVPVANIAEIADKFTRNEIMTSNEIRQIIGMTPSDNPSADELRNKNLTAPMGDEGFIDEEEIEEDEPMSEEEYNSRMKDIDDLDSQLDELDEEMQHSELMHRVYASPYYDPVKAHEYYERTKHLRERKSTSKLNDSGKNAASYVKQQLDAEKKSKIEEDKSRTDSEVESAKERTNTAIEGHKNLTQSKIDGLRSQLKNMSKEQKEQQREQIQSQIASIREDNSNMRKLLRDEYRKQSGELRTKHKETRNAIKEEYEEKYMQELDSMKSDSKFSKTRKRKK